MFDTKDSEHTSSKRKILIFISLVFIAVLSVAFISIDKNTGTTEEDVMSYYRGFAIDSNNRVYVGRLTRIDVYDNNQFQYSIDAHTNRNYCFTITNNQTILLSNAQTVYEMSLEGDVIDEYEDKYTQTINELRKYRNKFTADDGTEYRYSPVTHDIVRLDGEETIIVFHIEFA